jgi:hypothetical protein
MPLRSLPPPPSRAACTRSAPPTTATFALLSFTPSCATLPRAISSLAQHPHFDEVGPGTGGRLLESLHARINVSSSNTAIGIYCFLILSIRLVVRYDAFFWTPSYAGACLRARTKYFSFDVQVLLNGPYCSSYPQFAIPQLKPWWTAILSSFCGV